MEERLVNLYVLILGLRVSAMGIGIWGLILTRLGNQEGFQKGVGLLLAAIVLMLASIWP